MSDPAQLILGDKTFELPTVTGSEGEVGIDISKLRARSGAVTLDNGFANSSPSASQITFLNGEKGILRYRGYSIEDLAENATFDEVCFLLLHGELPDGDGLAGFKSSLREHADLSPEIGAFFDALPPTGHPMSLLGAAVAALPAFYGTANERSEEDFDLATMRLLGKMPALAAAIYRRQKGLGPAEGGEGETGYASRFLAGFLGGDVDPQIARALDILFILHADHEFNCSASTVRFVGSGHANLYASVSAGIAALWGPLHGGANQKVLEMLERIRDDGGDVDKYVAMAKDKTSGFRLMGFGHRVYKNFDPRARIIKGQCDLVLEKLGIVDPLLDVAKALEAHALKDEYFVERRLYPNVDFYSGIIYRALGIPTNLFTVLFAVGRMPGWISHWREMNSQKTRIGRPRQIYTGVGKRDWVPLDGR